MARNLTRSSSGFPAVLGLFQNAPLKSQQTQLPIDVEAWVVQEVYCRILPAACRVWPRAAFFAYAS